MEPIRTVRHLCRRLLRRRRPCRGDKVPPGRPWVNRHVRLLTGCARCTCASSHQNTTGAPLSENMQELALQQRRPHPPRPPPAPQTARRPSTRLHPVRDGCNQPVMILPPAHMLLTCPTLVVLATHAHTCLLRRGPLRAVALLALRGLTCALCGRRAGQHSGCRCRGLLGRRCRFTCTRRQHGLRQSHVPNC